MNNQRNDQIPNQQVTDEQIREIIHLKGQKLGTLLNKLKWPQELKQAWVDLLPTLTAEQIDELIMLTEENYLQQETTQIDKNFQAKAQALYSKYKANQKQIDDKVMEELKTIEQELEDAKQPVAKKK